tara:strand:- start:4703 stop:4879 length:177 start_codon:yes stop_codon:yes gene_type:complete
MKWREVIGRRLNYNSHTKGEPKKNECDICWRPVHMTCKKCKKTYCLEHTETITCKGAE